MGDLKISVVIPTYNGLERLKRTIESVRAQSFAAHEIIIVDDGSTDETPTIATLLGDAIVYVRTRNGGQQRARNYGVSIATGDWIALLDHDDMWEPDYLAEVNGLVHAHGVDVTLCNSRTWEEDDQGGGAWNDENRFLTHAPAGYWEKVGASPTDRWSALDRYDYASYIAWHPSQTSMFTIRRDLYLSLGGFDERMRGMGSENFEFEIRALRAANVGLIWRPLVRMTRHDSNASLDQHQMTMDLVETLLFAMDRHGLNPAEMAVVREALQDRLPDAISGSFTLGRYAEMRRYIAMSTRPLSLKARMKAVIGRLPKPAARGISKLLGA